MTRIIGFLLASSMSVVIAQTMPLGEADITYSTVCGAPGVGRQFSATKDKPKGLIHAREGIPGVRVGPAPNGYWTSNCKMPPPPKDCPSLIAPSWVGSAGYYCQPTQRTVPGRDVGREVELVSGQTASNRGSHILACHKLPNGPAWVVVSSYCERR